MPRGNQCRKKITIRPYAKPPQLPPDYYDKTTASLWKSLESRGSLQSSYNAVVHLVSHQFGPKLYQDVRNTLQSTVQDWLPSSNTTTTTPSSSLLSTVLSVYSKYTEYLLVCRHIFSTLDRTHAWNTQTNQAVPAHNHGSSLWHLGLSLWAERLEDLQLDAAIYRQWQHTLIDDWNLKDTSHRQELAQIWYMWQDLGKLPHQALQEDLTMYWTTKTQQWQDNYQPALFLQDAVDKHTHVQQWPWLPYVWLQKLLDYAYVAPHLNHEYLLKDEHFFQLMEEAKTSATAVQNLWMLAGRLNGGRDQTKAAVANYAKVKGLEIVQKTPAPQIIPTLWEFQQFVQQLIAKLAGFEQASLKNVWEQVVNDSAQPVAELLAKYLDSVLRNPKKLDAANEQWLPQILSALFTPLHAKDVFEAFYKRDLAKRLLWNRVVNMDTEKEVCSLLKAECGAAYTSKMEGMFQDIDWSRETMLVYKQTKSESAVEMEVQVLTTGYWPVYPQYPNLHLPDSLKEPQEQFASHYKSKYQGRRMTWQYALGHCVVKCNGFSKSYEVVVSLCQALVLSQFETGSKLTLPDLMTKIGMEDRGEMERLLLSLSLGKDGTRVLRKLDHEGGKKVRGTVDDRDLFCINEKFESNQRRIRINNIMMKETKEERTKTNESVSKDRLYTLDAVLVRIMKARKTLSHQSLLAQVMEQVKFPASSADIKKRIESLIEREYMERDGKDHSRYNYLA